MSAHIDLNPQLSFSGFQSRQYSIPGIFQSLRDSLNIAVKYRSPRGAPLVWYLSPLGWGLGISAATDRSYCNFQDLFLSVWGLLFFFLQQLYFQHRFPHFRSYFAKFSVKLCKDPTRTTEQWG